MNSLNSRVEALTGQQGIEKSRFYMAAAPSDQVRSSRKVFDLASNDFEATASLAPPVTVVLEGRSICHLIHLTKLSDYQSFAATLHRLFAGMNSEHHENGDNGTGGLDLSNAVPGHVIAYEDVEDDLLLAGDLSWKDFVRVAKRIRIMPAKSRERKNNGRGHKCN